MTQSESEYGESQILEGRWLQDEHDRFLNAIIQHGKDWKTVEKLVKTRTGPQVRSHAQKYFLKLTKILKERRKHKSKDHIEKSQIENELTHRFRQQDMTENTPEEIKVIIGEDWDKRIAPQRKHHHKKYFIKNNTQQKRTTPANQNKIKVEPEPIHKLSTQSYFIQIIKYNECHLEDGSNLSSLFDFAKIQHENIEEGQQQELQPQIRKRTKSFTLPDEQQDQTKLRERIQILHRAMEEPDHF